MDVLAHSATIAGGVEPELLVFGIVVVVLAILLRPSRTGNARTSLITLIVGIMLILGAFTVPRLP